MGSDDAEVVVLPVPLPLLSAICTLRISIPPDLRTPDSRRAGGQAGGLDGAAGVRRWLPSWGAAGWHRLLACCMQRAELGSPGGAAGEGRSGASWPQLSAAQHSKGLSSLRAA